MKREHKLAALRRDLQKIQERLDDVAEEVHRLQVLTTPIRASTTKWMNVLPPLRRGT